MKREYLQTLPKPTDIKNEAYNTYLSSVQQLFAKIQLKYDKEIAEQLFDELKNLNDVRRIKKAHKKLIYEYFLKYELEHMEYIRGRHSVAYSIMKLTKCKIDDFKLNWREVFERIHEQIPEIAGSSHSKSMQLFLKQIKCFFDDNNALQVIKYFEQKNFKDIYKIIMLFVKISPQTKEQVFNQFVKELILRCQAQKISKTDFLSLFFWLQKNRKHISFALDVYQFVNNLVLQYILAGDRNSKKSSFENNFNSSSAEVLEKVLGKSNPDSIKLIDVVFSFLKKFVKPLQNSTKSVMFIYWLLKSIFQRMQVQKKTKQRLNKLIQKIMTKKKEEQEQDQLQPETKQESEALEKKQSNLDVNEEGKQEEKEKEKENDNQQDDDEEDFEDDDEEHEEDELQQLLYGQSSKINFEKDDEEKGDTDEEKKQKMEKLLANQLTPQIMNCLEKHIQELFQVLYYVNSKKTISHLLRYIYRLFPKFAVKSLQVLNKAANIPNINEDGLIKNLTVTVQHMFMDENYKDGIANVMKILDKAFNSRRIVDVWNIYESVSSKIPLLDQKDLENIDDKDKEQFQKTFQMNHDRFYDQYSGHMLEAFKKLLSEGQYLEKDQHRHYAVTMQQLYYNSYPFMRKRLLEEVMEALSENANALSLLYLNIAELPNRQNEVLKNYFSLINEQNRDTQELRLHYLSVLCKNMKLEQLKPYLRKMAHRGHFKIIEEYNAHKVSEQIKWTPYKTTLNYLYEDPKLSLQFEKTVEQRKKHLKQLEEYRNQLINQASQIIDKMPEDEPDSVADRVIKSYTKPAKISTQSQRKKLHEILQLVAKINFLMDEKLIDIKNKKKLELVPSDVGPYNFLNPQQPFNKKIKKLLNIQQVLHDPKLISVLNIMLTNEYFQYFDMSSLEQKAIQKERKKNKNHQSPDCANRIVYGSEYLSSARNYMAMLLHKTNAGKNYKIDALVEQLFILSMVNANETYKDIRSMFQQSNKIYQYREYLFAVMKQKIENRELIKRVSSTIDFLSKSQAYKPYSDQQILEFVDYHATLSQSHDSKIKELAIKSFRKFGKIIEENPISDVVSQGMLKYRNTDKMEMIWLIYVGSHITHFQFQKDKQLTKKRVLELLKLTQGLLLHDTRSVRRISLFIYPSLVRILKKLNTSFQTKTFETEIYTEKSLEEFVETGFIRKQQVGIDLKDKSLHKKHPQPGYRVKIPSELPSDIFSFLIDNPENAIKFIKSYHSDLASTTEMLVSAMQSAVMNVDLFTIATKAIEKLIYIFKTKSMSVSTGEFLVGSKFFKYLCQEDARSGFKFFHTVKDFVLSCLGNLESLDNQTLVILYSYNLMGIYQSIFTQRIPEIENFLTKIFTEIIKKSSKAIYTKLQTIFFKKIKNYDAIQFLIELCQKMMGQNKKVYRAGYLLAVISGKNYSSSQKLIRKMLDDKIQLQNQNYTNNILNYLLTFPTSSAWQKSQLQKTKIIDMDKLESQSRIKQFLNQYIIYSNKQLLNYLIKQIKQMVTSQSIDLIKTGFNILNTLIKNCSNLYLNSEIVDFVVDLLTISMGIIKDKKQLQLDFDAANKAIGFLFGSELLPTHVFEKYLNTLLDHFEPTKKFTDLLQDILNSPINYLKLSPEMAQKFVLKILDLETNSALYKPILKILSTFFRYNVKCFDKMNQKQKDNKNRRVLLLQSYLLAQNIKLDPSLVKEVLRLSQKDKKNMWAREMMLIRGQRQYFDDESTYQVWREIKQLSNPYHYHA